MAYEIRELTGSLFRVDKEEPEDRDYSGQARISGELYWLSGYLKISKNGKRYLDLRFKAQVEKPDRRPLSEAGDDLGF
jgi:hypothetical protein